MGEKNQIEIYHNEKSNITVAVKLVGETLWLDQYQIAHLFDTDRTSIGRHLKKNYTSKELDIEATSAKIAQVQKDGGREVKRNINFYNLDAILSVGYRVNSKKGTAYRIWANQVLKDYLVKGYSINKKRLAEKDKEIKFLHSGIQIVSRAIEEKATQKGFEYLNQFLKGLSLLDDYDHESLDTKGITLSEAIYPKRKDYQSLIDRMKAEFDSDIFGFEKDQSFESAIAQISKGFDETYFYPSIEEKAATLLYPVVKNHAFTDGNKRIAAACFLMFLQQNNLLINKLGNPIISNEALASVTLFIASSKPEEMEVVKNLVISILNRNKN